MPDTRDTFYIQSAESGKVISITSQDAGSPLIQWTNQHVPEQQWLQIWAAQGYKFRNLYTGLYMDVKGGSDKAGTQSVIGIGWGFVFPPAEAGSSCAILLLL